MIPPCDRVGQIASYKSYLENLFETRVRGMWVPERVWEQNLVSDLADAGVEYTVLDDLHFRDRSEEAKALVRQVVDEIGSGATLSLVTTSRLFDVEPTEDRSRLLLAVSRFLDRYDPGRGPGPASDHESASLQPAGLAPSRPGDLASFFSGLTTYRFVGNVAKVVGADDGRRKAFVWISAGVLGDSVTAAGSNFHCMIMSAPRLVA